MTIIIKIDFYSLSDKLFMQEKKSTGYITCKFISILWMLTVWTVKRVETNTKPPPDVDFLAEIFFYMLKPKFVFYTIVSPFIQDILALTNI